MTQESVNQGCKQLFNQKGRAIDGLPPTQAALIQHTKRTAYQAGHCWGQNLLSCRLLIPTSPPHLSHGDMLRPLLLVRNAQNDPNTPMMESVQLPSMFPEKDPALMQHRRVMGAAPELPMTHPRVTGGGRGRTQEDWKLTDWTTLLEAAQACCELLKCAWGSSN